MELELQRQQQEAMDRQMAQMKLMFEEQFKKQQDEIESLRKVSNQMKRVCTSVIFYRLDFASSDSFLQILTRFFNHASVCYA